MWVAKYVPNSMLNHGATMARSRSNLLLCNKEYGR